ncbi:MAG: phosphate signaling complex protein PhoU [Myxococcota bacterium]
MTQPPHLEALQERHLAELRRQVRGMADLVLRALADAATALSTRDRRLAYSVILADNRIDHLEGYVDRLCQEFLVRHMPVGADLRFIVATIKVNSELERIGDYADAIARRVIQLVGAGDLPQLDRMLEMAKRSGDTVTAAVDAFLAGDVDAAQKAFELEAETDEMNHAIFDALAHAEHTEMPLATRFALLGILNRIERVADRASNIAEDAIYAAKGEVRAHQPRHERKVLLLSPWDATLGPMAEAIAKSRAPLHTSFFSCGLWPRPLDPRMVAFMAKRGYDVTRPRPRTLADAGPLEDYYVVVTLSREAEEGCPPLPYKTVALAWDIADPSKVEGTPEQVEAAYAHAHDDIQSKLGDLLAGLLGTDPNEEVP